MAYIKIYLLIQNYGILKELWLQETWKSDDIGQSGKYLKYVKNLLFQFQGSYLRLNRKLGLMWRAGTNAENDVTESQHQSCLDD